jgi:hypothetical protein
MLHKTFTKLAATIGAGCLAATLALGAPAQAAAAPAAPAGQEAAVAGHRVPTGRALVRVLIRTTSALTGESVPAVRAALRDGQSLAQFAAANGSSGDAVVQDVVGRARERLDKAVEKGRISRQLADALLAELTTKATEIVNDSGLGAQLDEQRPRP